LVVITEPPLGAIVPDEDQLNVDECEELAEALCQDAASLPNRPNKENLLKLAEAYRALAIMKSLVLRKVN